MVTLDVSLVPAELAERDLNGWAVAVLDILRATTVMVTALENGAAQVVPVLTPEEALAGAGSRQGALVGGERKGVALPGFDCGNSPYEYSREKVAGKTVYLTTTNGTVALRHAARAGAVTVACFRNRTAVARWLAEQEKPVLLACAGRKGRFSWEDLAGAGAVVAALEAVAPGVFQPTDAARLARQVFAEWEGRLKELLASTEHGRFLIDIGFRDDLPYCAQLDVSRLVPHWEGGSLTAPQARA
ncbi:MAG: 2-phosphosulfolactate phosphatase [Firmicutes bacterium]|nr:2-phosphosulfolactate phosphatase [Bacillota bacterium]